MPDKAQEQQAIALFIESFRIMHGVELAIRSDHAEDFPDFILADLTANNEIWVEVVQAVESGELLAAERRVQRLYEVAAQEYRARGEEVVLTVTLQGVENVTPSPGFGVTGVLLPGPARRISPPEWIAKALEQKARPNRYGPAERAKATLLIDCSREVLIGQEDAVELRSDLGGNTMGFKEVWCASVNWKAPQALVLAPLPCA
jgi:hypothetical protein